MYFGATHQDVAPRTSVVSLQPRPDDQFKDSVTIENLTCLLFFQCQATNVILDQFCLMSEERQGCAYFERFTLVVYRELKSASVILVSVMAIA